MEQGILTRNSQVGTTLLVALPLGAVICFFDLLGARALARGEVRHHDRDVHVFENVNADAWDRSYCRRPTMARWVMSSLRRCHRYLPALGRPRLLNLKQARVAHSVNARSTVTHMPWYVHGLQSNVNYHLQCISCSSRIRRPSTRSFTFWSSSRALRFCYRCSWCSLYR